MLKKAITFEDPFTGEEVTNTYYFNLTKAEITKWEFSVRGGVRAHLESVMQNPEENGKEIMAAIEDLIRRAYGRRDGSNFIKNDQIWEEFKSSEPYSQLFWDLCTNAEEAAKFMNAIVPRELANQEQLPVDKPVRLVDDVEIRPEPKVLSRQELVAMDHAELQSGLAEGRYILSNDAAKID